MDLDELLNAPVPLTTKGWPALAGTLPLRAAGRQGWNLLREDLPLPVAVLKASALAHNSRWMRGFLEYFDVRLCPHGKTTMAPQLFARQLADGAWGITVATVQQLMVCRRFGVPRVLMANQLVGRQAIRAVLAELQADPGFEFLCLVNSLEGVELLRRELEQMPLGRPFEVLLEGGVAGGRTGCRTREEALSGGTRDRRRAGARAGRHRRLRGCGRRCNRCRTEDRGFPGVSGRACRGVRPRGSVCAGADHPERRRLEVFRSGDGRVPRRGPRSPGRDRAAQRLLSQPRFQGLHRCIRPAAGAHARGRAPRRGPAAGAGALGERAVDAADRARDPHHGQARRLPRHRPAARPAVVPPRAPPESAGPRAGLRGRSACTISTRVCACPPTARFGSATS